MADTAGIFGQETEAVTRLLVEAHNVRAERGEIWINGAVDKTLIELAAMRLVTQVQSGRFNRILMFLNSPGGVVEPGFALIDFMRTSPIPIWTINVGEVCSMGLSIFLAGHKRFGFPHSQYMAHSISTGLGYDKLAEHQTFLTAAQRQQEQLAKFYASRTGKSAKWWAKKFTEPNYWFDVDEALNLGVIDEIVVKPEVMDSIFADVVDEGESA